MSTTDNLAENGISKPWMTTESYRKREDFLTYFPGLMDKILTNNELKGFLFICDYWNALGDFNWGDSRYWLDAGSVDSYNTKMANSGFLKRGTGYFNAVPLFVKASNGTENTDDNGTSWNKEKDSYTFITDYDYSVSNAKHQGVKTYVGYWENSSTTMTVSITIPSSVTKGNVFFNAKNKKDITIGTRLVADNDNVGGIRKYSFTDADYSNGKLNIIFKDEDDLNTVHIREIGIQLFSGSKPATPGGLNGSFNTDGTVNLTWDAVSGAEAYFIYERNQLIGVSTTNSWKDKGLGDRIYGGLSGSRYYLVSAYDKNQGEGEMSGQKTVTDGGTSTIVDDSQTDVLNYRNQGDLTQSWVHDSRAESYNGTISYTKQLDDVVDLTFEGDYVKLFMQKGPGAGKFNISLDGSYVTTLDGYSESHQHQVKVYEKTWSSVGTHTIKVRCNHEKNSSSSDYWVNFDYIEYGETPTKSGRLANPEELTGLPSSEGSSPEVSLYPNPSSSGIVNLIMQGYKVQQATIQVIDLSGRIVYTKSQDIVADNEQIEINLAGMAKGMYSLRVTSKQDVRNIKLMLK